MRGPDLLRRWFGRRPRALPRPSPRVVLRLDLRDLPRCQGVAHTVAEGQRLARRCRTELPEFRGDAFSPPSTSR